MTAKLINQSDFQSMASGEGVSIARKNKQAISDQSWTVPLVMAGNPIPDYKDNSGSISRRLAMFLFTTLVQEKNAVQTIMEQKINILVQNVCKSVASVLQSNPASSTSPAGVSLARDVAALERLVSASVAALKASSQRGTSATNSAQYSAGSPMRAPPPPPSL